MRVEKSETVEATEPTSRANAESVPTKFSGADWLRSVTKQELSPFGELVADVLGQVYAGIYHIQSEVLNKRADFTHPSCVEIVTYGDLSTYDFDILTKLVVLCHDHAIRFTVAPASNRHLRLLFHKRVRESSRIYDRHPTLEDAARGIRERLRLLSARATEGETKGAPNCSNNSRPPSLSSPAPPGG
jgi:hypothetical protein